MRVIAGTARRTKLAAPEGTETRPTSDKIKSSLFNIMTSDLYKCKFLDLFSGSGGIGIEALSRGAQKAVFVEKSKNAFKCIQQNISKTNFASQSMTLNMPYVAALNYLGEKNQQFDIIFMDPPYNKDIINNAIKLIIKYNLLAPDGYIVIEKNHAYHISYDKEVILWKEKKYGNTKIVFLKGTEEYASRHLSREL